MPAFRQRLSQVPLCEMPVQLWLAWSRGTTPDDSLLRGCLRNSETLQNLEALLAHLPVQKYIELADLIKSYPSLFGDTWILKFSVFTWTPQHQETHSLFVCVCLHAYKVCCRFTFSTPSTFSPVLVPPAVTIGNSIWSSTPVRNDSHFDHRGQKWAAALGKLDVFF